MTSAAPAAAILDTTATASTSASESIAGQLPFEILVEIFVFAILAVPDRLGSKESGGKSSSSNTKRSSSPPWKLLLLSKSFKQALEPQHYSRVSLVDTTSLAHFASTLKARPDLTRKVKSLWIAPTSLDSDFITALKPPTDGITALPSNVSQPLSHIRAILRACRSLRHLALDGCLCTLKATNSFGTNCQPLSLVSINPYSFLGGFGSPMFRKVRRLEVCDTSLASEEVEGVRSMPDLCHFIWTSPREYSDSKRDVSAFFRIVQPSILSPSTLQLSLSSSLSPVNGSLSSSAASFSAHRDDRGYPLRSSSTDSMASSSSSLLPIKPFQPRHLKTVEIRTGQTRAAELATYLARQVEVTAARLKEHSHWSPEDLAGSFSSMTFEATNSRFPSSSAVPIYIDSSAHTSTLTHPGTGVEMKTRPLVDEDVIDEWECLRDLICGTGQRAVFEETVKRRRREREKEKEKSGTKGSIEDEEQGDDDDEPQEEETAEQELDPGMALRRLWIEWCQNVESGALEVFDFRGSSGK